MLRTAISCLACLISAACDFDRQMQYDRRYPATLTVVNRSAAAVDVSEIYGDPASQALFSLNGRSLSPGEPFRLRIPERVFDGIREGAFFVSASCTGRQSQALDGHRLERASHRV